MMNDFLLYLVIALIVGLVILVAFRKGFNTSLRWGGVEAEFTKSPTQNKKSVSIGEKLSMDEGEIGDVTGVREDSGAQTPGDSSTTDVDVLRGAKLEKVKIRSITGVVRAGEKRDA